MESRAVFGAMCVFLGHLCLSTAAVGQALPDGKGKAEFLDVCTPCHRTELTTRLRKNPEEWKKIVDDNGSSWSEWLAGRHRQHCPLPVHELSSRQPCSFRPRTIDSAPSPSASPTKLNFSGIERAKRCSPTMISPAADNDSCAVCGQDRAIPAFCRCLLRRSSVFSRRPQPGRFASRLTVSR